MLTTRALQVCRNLDHQIRWGTPSTSTIDEADVLLREVEDVLENDRMRDDRQLQAMGWPPLELSDEEGRALMIARNKLEDVLYQVGW